MKRTNRRRSARRRRETRPRRPTTFRPAAATAALPLTGLELLRVNQVLAILGLSRTGFWRLRQRDAWFPAPVRLSAFSIRFRARDLDAWLSKRQSLPGAAA